MLVNKYPSKESIGSAIPNNAVITNGKKQYPNTLALLEYVSVLEKCPP
jgi:hypothetical protein